MGPKRNKKTYAQKVIGDTGFPGLAYREGNGAVYQTPVNTDVSDEASECSNVSEPREDLLDLATLAKRSDEIREAYKVIGEKRAQSAYNWNKKRMTRSQKKTTCCRF